MSANKYTWFLCHLYVFWGSLVFSRSRANPETPLFIILFVRNFRRVCSQFWLSVRNSVSGPLIEIQEEIHHFAVLGGGGVG